MSVINQMLRDLDARHASARERAGLPAALRTLPPAQRRGLQPWQLLALGVGIGAAVAGGIASFLMVPPPPPLPPPAIASPPVVEPPPAALAAPNIAPAPIIATIEDSAMKLDTRIALPEIAKPTASAQSRPAVPKPAGEIKSASVHVPKDMPKVAQPPVEPAIEAQIDLRPKGGTSREQADAEYRKGMQAVGNGDLAGAQAALRRALDIDPKFAKARQALLSVLASGRQWPEVRQTAADGLALDPSRSDRALILARVEHDQGDAVAALDTLERHAAQAAGNAEYQGLFAYLLQKRQRHADAAQRYRAALALRPNEGRWWFGLGMALEAVGQGGEARDAFMKARETGNLSADMLATLEQKLK